MTNRETLDALDEAGRLLAPILQAEAPPGRNSASVWVTPSGKLCVGDHVGKGYANFIIGRGDTFSAALAQFLANRSDKLAELEREAQLAAEFEAFKALKREAA